MENAEKKSKKSKKEKKEKETKSTDEVGNDIYTTDDSNIPVITRYIRKNLNSK